MGRAPCCDKVGLKKGPWTAEEDQILISFVQTHGHSNWRALPKQACLLRCGKSCRLRWINYLRPDIKRGNFSREEEDTIIQLHEMMGNRWSAIAARLPGRTDNEIKNVWHTHLKKRLQHYQPTKSQPKNGRKSRDQKNVTTPTTTNDEYTFSENNFSENSDLLASSSSPQHSYTTSEDISSVTEVSSVQLSNNNNNATEGAQFYENSIDDNMTSLEYNNLPIIDETFWESQELPLDDAYNMSSEFSNVIMEDNQFKSVVGEDNFAQLLHGDNYGDDNMDFWLDVFVQAGGASQLQEF